MWVLLRFATATLILFGASVDCPQAQVNAYPAKPVTFVVPFAPGGANDVLARLVGQKLEQRLGKPFVIENRPGASSITAAAAVARSVPDGYTIMMAASTAIAINPALYKTLPYSSGVDFVPLALLDYLPFVLVVKSSLPANSVSDLIKLAKEEPGQLLFASAGAGTPHHLYAELLMTKAGIKMTHVPYRGTVPALNDLIGGHVDLMFTDIGPALGLITEGKIRALGVSTKNRVGVLSNVAPIAETGVPGFDAASWQMVVAPADTPKDIVDKLHAEIKSILAEADFKEQVINLGMLPIDTPSVSDMQTFVKAEITKWGEVVEQAGIAGSM